MVLALTHLFEPMEFNESFCHIPEILIQEIEIQASGAHPLVKFPRSGGRQSGTGSHGPGVQDGNPFHWWVEEITPRLPSGKRLHNYGKSQFLMEKSSLNGHVQ